MSTQVFPTLKGLTFNISRTQIWSSNVQTNVSGKESRIGYWSTPRYQWDLTFAFLRSNPTFAELQSLMGFFNNRKGMFDSFLYADKDDNAVVGQTIATGDAVKTTFQLVRTWGGNIEPILAPNVISAVYLDGVLQSSGYTVSTWASTTPGIITFSSAPGNGVVITADYSFYFPVRFLTDTTTYDNFLYQLYSNNKISLMSLK